MDIITLACEMAQNVEVFIQKVRSFYYSVMLMGYVCPECQGHLLMTAEGRCECTTCSHEFDPTVEFQRCGQCGGKPSLAIRRYYCRDCGAEVESRFLFDGMVFNAMSGISWGMCSWSR